MSVQINSLELKSKVILKFSDIESGVAFSSWLKQNMPLYVNKDIPIEHLLIYAEYIKERIKEAKNIDHRSWIHAINQLEKKIEIKDEYLL